MALTFNEALRKNELDAEGAFITGKRHKAGIPPAIRKKMASLNEKFLFCYFGSDIEQQLRRPPAHVQVAFDEVFGSRKFEGPFSDGKENLRLVEHPILARWCIVQRVRDKENEEHLWQVVRIFSSADEEELDSEFIPSDYADIPILHHLAGLIGEHRTPDRRDFEAFEKFDRWKYGVDNIENMMIQREILADQQLESDWESFEHDFVSYHAHMIADEANQRAGSMQKTWLVQADYSERLRQDPRFYKIEQRKGYKIRQKRSKEEWREFVMELYQRDPEFRRQLLDEVGMDKRLARQLPFIEETDPIKAKFYKVPEGFLEQEAAVKDQQVELRRELKAQIHGDLERAKKIMHARMLQEIK